MGRRFAPRQPLRGNGTPLRGASVPRGKSDGAYTDAAAGRLGGVNPPTRRCMCTSGDMHWDHRHQRASKLSGVTAVLRDDCQRNRRKHPRPRSFHRKTRLDNHSYQN